MNRRSLVLPKPLLPLLAFALCGIVLNSAVARQGFNMNAPTLPDSSITPGATLPVTAKDICVPGYSKKVRDVPQAVKEQAYKEYGITHRARGEYEVDHLISLELGGSNSLKNLWPQSYKTKPWNAHVKDKLENALHDDVCTNKIDLATAQQKISRNWISAYKAEFPDDPLTSVPVPKSDIGVPRQSIFTRLKSGAASVIPKRKTTSPPAAVAGQVWVNTKSGVYWRPGTRYYGKTKQGKYMSEADAIQAGYHAAGGH